MGNSVANTGMHNPTGGVWRPSNNGVIVKTELCELLTEQWRTQEFFSGGGSTNSVEDRRHRGRGSGGGSPLVRGSGGSCNLVQEISFHIVKFS